MAQTAGPLNGSNLSQDYQFTAPAVMMLGSGTLGASHLAVTLNSVAVGEALISCTRTNGEKVMLHFRNSAAYTIDTSGTKKVFIEVDQTKLDDGSANGVGGTDIAVITTAASYPATNSYIALASITGGAITDARTRSKFVANKMGGLLEFSLSTGIAGAATVDLGTATGNTVHVTGSGATITSFGSTTQVGAIVNGIFDGTNTLTHNGTSLILPGGANISTSAGDMFVATCEAAGNWRVTYQKANGASISTSTITGEIRMWPLNVAPSGFLVCAGTAVSRATYSSLFATIVPSLGTFTVTIATPGVISLTAHGMNIGDSFYVTTTGATPTGLTVNTLYYVIAAGYGANSFQFSATRGGAAVNTTGSQSGTHTMRYCPYGLGDGSTTFNVPNMKGSTPVGLDTAQTEFLALGKTGGAKTHTLTSAESGLPAHSHATSPGIFTTSGGSSKGTSDTGSGGQLTISNNAAADASSAHNNLQPYNTVNFIIAT